MEITVSFPSFHVQRENNRTIFDQILLSDLPKDISNFRL